MAFVPTINQIIAVLDSETTRQIHIVEFSYGVVWPSVKVDSWQALFPTR